MVGLPFVIERYGMCFDQAIRTWRETHNTEQRSLCTLGWVCKLIKPAPARWRAVNEPNLVALVRAGATIINGKLAERPPRAPQSMTGCSPGDHTAGRRPR